MRGKKVLRSKNPETEVKSKIPPLFVKLEKYNEIIANIKTLKSYVLALRDALDALNDMEKELKRGFEVIQRAVDKINMVVANLDEKLLKLEGIERKISVEPSKEIENYIKSLYEETEKIKEELKSLS